MEPYAITARKSHHGSAVRQLRGSPIIDDAIGEKLKRGKRGLQSNGHAIALEQMTLIPSASLGRHSDIDGSNRVGGAASARARIPGDAHRNVRAKKLTAAVCHSARGLPAHGRMSLKCFCGHVEHVILDIVAIRDGSAEQDGAGPRHASDVRRDHASSAGLGGAYAHITFGRQAHEPLSGAYAGGVQGRLIHLIHAKPPSKTKQPPQTHVETSTLAGVDEKERYTRKMTWRAFQKYCAPETTVSTTAATIVAHATVSTMEVV